MNYLKAGLMVKLGLSNPYEIKPQFRFFNKQYNTAKVKFINKRILCKDFYIIRFQLPTQNQCLGIKIGQYIWITIGDQKRPYVPISPIDQPNYFDLLIRDMTKKNKGSFTERFLKVAANQEVIIEGPGSQFLYEGFGKMKYTDSETKEQKKKRFKNIGIIAYASAVSGAYSLIQSVAMNYDNKTALSLLWVGDKQSDFIFLNELATIAKLGKLNLNLMLTEFEKDWLGPYGKVIEEQINDYMPPPLQDTMILMFGLEGPLAHVPSLIKTMGFKNSLSF